MGLFKKGYKAVEEEKKRQESRRSLYRFFITGDGAEADIRFLTDNPVTFYEHSVKTVRNGKEVYDNVLCTSSDGHCPLCAEGERPSFKGAYLIWDNREYEAKDSSGKKKSVQGSLKLYVAGTKVLSQIQRLYTKYGLLDREYTIVRLGESTSTTYTFERGDRLPELSQKEIEGMLPENLRKLYDGSQESLQNIIEKILESDLPNGTNTNKGDEYEADTNYNKQLVNVDDTEDEDEEEEVRPKRAVLPKKKSSAKSVLKARRR